MSPAAPPVFVDDSGRRRAITRRAVRVLLAGFAGYLALLVAGFAHDPHLGAIGLPTFGLPNLIHPAPPATVLGESSTRAAAQAEGGGDGQAAEGADAAHAADDRARSTASPAATSPTGRLTPTTARTAGPTTPAGSTPAGATPPATSPTVPTTTTTTPSNGHGKGTTTTTAPTTTTTTPTTAPTGPGQGSGSASGVTSAKGPDGSGPPGQQRRPTTTTTSPTLVG